MFRRAFSVFIAYLQSLSTKPSNTELLKPRKNLKKIENRFGIYESKDVTLHPINTIKQKNKMKIKSYLSIAAVAVMIASCGGNKNAEADSAQMDTATIILDEGEITMDSTGAEGTEVVAAEEMTAPEVVESANETAAPAATPADAKEAAKETVKEAKETAKDIVKEAKEQGKELVKEAKEQGKEIVDGAKDKANELLNK